MKTVFCILFCIFLVVYPPFILPNLFFAYQESTCVTTMVDGFSFNLKMWLKVDAFLKVGIIFLLLITAMVASIRCKFSIEFVSCSACIYLLYNTFNFAWVITGSVLFWGKLNPLGVCKGGVRDYMYAALIITYVAICCSFLLTRSDNSSKN